jgi:hypothetical protein
MISGETGWNEQAGVGGAVVIPPMELRRPRSTQAATEAGISAERGLAPGLHIIIEQRLAGTTHFRPFPDRLQAFLLKFGRIRILEDDLVTAFTVNLVGRNVRFEEPASSSVKPYFSISAGYWRR